MIDRQKDWATLIDAVAAEVAWEGGTGSAWRCDCILGAHQLNNLLRLAFMAPRKARIAFIEELKST